MRDMDDKMGRLSSSLVVVETWRRKSRHGEMQPHTTSSTLALHCLWGVCGLCHEECRVSVWPGVAGGNSGMREATQRTCPAAERGVGHGVWAEKAGLLGGVPGTCREKLREHF